MHGLTFQYFIGLTTAFLIGAALMRVIWWQVEKHEKRARADAGKG